MISLIGHGFFPSKYFDPADYPVYLMTLVGTFADGTGAILGTPFSIGLGRTVVVPTGAARLQLGLNDNLYGNTEGYAANSGSLTVSVTGLSAVPEPSTLALVATGLFCVVGSCAAAADRRGDRGHKDGGSPGGSSTRAPGRESPRGENPVSGKTRCHIRLSGLLSPALPIGPPAERGGIRRQLTHACESQAKRSREAASEREGFTRSGSVAGFCRLHRCFPGSDRRVGPSREHPGLGRQQYRSGLRCADWQRLHRHRGGGSVRLCVAGGGA